MILPSRNSQETPEDKEKQKKMTGIAWHGVVEQEILKLKVKKCSTTTIDLEREWRWSEYDKKTQNAITDWI